MNIYKDIYISTCMNIYGINIYTYVLNREEVAKLKLFQMMSFVVEIYFNS